MATWRKYIEQEVKGNKDTLVKCTLSEDELDEEFDDSYGTLEGKPFTAWGEKYVYFPVVYDGSEWVDSVLRNPCNTATWHIGGQ